MPIGASIGGAAISGGLGWWGARQAADQQRKGYDRAYALNLPYMQAGQGALTKLSSLYGIGPNGQQAFNPQALAEFRNTPGYQFTLGEGLRATDFGDSARGQLLSSNNLRNRQSFGSGLANNTFMGSYVQPLQQLAGMGQQATGAASGAAIGGAAANAGGTVGGINAIGGALGNAGNNYMLYNMLGNRSAYGGGSAWSPEKFSSAWNSTPGGGSLGPGGWNTSTNWG